MNPPTRAALVTLAREMAAKGIEEVPPKSNQDPEGWIDLFWESVGDVASAIAKQRSIDGDEGYAWCCAFVSWLFAECGYPLGVGYAYCPNLVVWLGTEGLWRGPAYVPDPGDLIFYRGATRVNHVGVVVDVLDPYLVTVEGNYNNGLNKRQVRLDRSDIAGYGVVLSE